jgi:prevent-host-death family protein
MRHISAREAKNRFGRLIDDARAAPVAVEKHGRPVVVVVAFEEYERLTETVRTTQSGNTPEKREK